MAEDCGLSTLAATEAISRSRSGSSSGSSESDVSPICKISPLVPTLSTSPRPLTPKKRHRLEMEQEARRQEAIRAAERVKAECEAMTRIDEREVKEEVALERISEHEQEIPGEQASTPPTELAALEKDTESVPNVKDGKTVPAKKRKAEADVPKPEPITSGKRRRSIPKKFVDEPSPPTAKAPKRTPKTQKIPKTPKAPKTPKTPKTPTSPSAVTGSEADQPLPEGWRRILTQRMQGESAGKFDVYIWSPSGKKFRSRPQLMAYLEETGSTLSIDRFSFKHKGTAVTPARLRKTPQKDKKSPKKTTKEAKVVQPKTGRPRKNSASTTSPSKTGRKSPGKAAARKSPSKTVKKVKGKQQRKVMKPPPDTGPKKASRAQQLQKLLVKINFQKPGDIREMSSDESSETSSEDDFDPGTAEEADDLSDISMTPSPPSTKKARRHSSPAV